MRLARQTREGDWTGFGTHSIIADPAIQDITPVMNTNTRSLTTVEASEIQASLARFREHFKQWSHQTGKEWYLADFAYYEGCGQDECCVDILKKCAPLALGQTLVHDYGFEWCMIEHGNDPKIGVNHPDIARPLDLYQLDDAPMLDPDEHDDDMEPFDPGEGAIQSIYAIVRGLGLHPPYA